MNKLNWNHEIFEKEFGRITNNAFEVLNETYSDYYGYNELTSKGVNLVAKYYDTIADKFRCGIIQDNTVSDFLNDIEQTYYNLLQYRKQKDIEYKLKNIDKDF